MGYSAWLLAAGVINSPIIEIVDAHHVHIMTDGVKIIYLPCFYIF